MSAAHTYREYQPSDIDCLARLWMAADAPA
jgi:hypothetical protein